jgi:chromosome segregation ATPase
LQQERLEDVSERKRELGHAVDKKRLELLQLKQKQLAALQRDASELAPQIAALRDKVSAYETRAAEVELPPGVVRLGKKQTDGRVVPVSQRPAEDVAAIPAE